MRHSQILALMLAGALLAAAAASAQDTPTPSVTATSTVTRTPTATATATPFSTPPRPYGALVPPASFTLLNNQSAAATSEAEWIAHWPHCSLQVTKESGSCTSVQLTIETINHTPANKRGKWSAVKLGSADTIGPGDLTADAMTWTLPPGLRYIRAVIQPTPSSCPLSVDVECNP